MKFKALKSGFKPFKEIDVYNYANWLFEYYGYGKLTLKMSMAKYTPEIKYIYHPEFQQLAIIKKVKRNDQEAILEGKMMIFDLYRYVIKTKKTYENKSVEFIIKDLVATFYTSDILIQPITQETTPIVEFLEVEGENLAEYILELAEQYEVGVKMLYIYEELKAMFIVYQGDDNTLNKNPLSKDFDSVIDYLYVNDEEDVVNYIYIKGKEETGIITEVDLRVDPTEEIREFWVDASSMSNKDMTTTQYVAALQQRGREKAAKYIIDESIDITPSQFIREEAKIVLGEKRRFINGVQASSANFLLSEQRVTGLLYGYQNGGVRKTIIFGNQELLKTKKNKEDRT